VERIRSLIPGVTISTDLITGFCFEDAQDHQDTLSLMELVKYNFAFMFMYSMRKVRLKLVVTVARTALQKAVPIKLSWLLIVTVCNT